MLLWLQNWFQARLPKSITVLSKLFIFCASFHIIFLFIIFFMYKGDSPSLTFFAHRGFNPDAPIIFMPLFKHMQPRVLKSSIAASPKSAPTTEQKSGHIQQEQEKKNDKVTQLIAVDVKKKSKTKKEKLKSKSKKDALAKMQSKKMQATPKEKSEKKKEEKKPEVLSPAKVEQQESGTNDAQYIGRSDLDALQMQEFISQEMAQNWKPPYGIPKDKTCDIKIVVDWQGALKEIIIAKSSSILMYDNAARDAISAMKFPKWLWGKEFTITFKQ